MTNQGWNAACALMSMACSVFIYDVGFDHVFWMFGFIVASAVFLGLACSLHIPLNTK